MQPLMSFLPRKIYHYRKTAHVHNYENKIKLLSMRLNECRDILSIQSIIREVVRGCLLEHACEANIRIYQREAGTFVPASWLFNDCYPSHRFIAVVIKNTNFGKVLSNRSFLYWYELFRDK